MKSLTALWRVVAEEMATICCTSATLDYKKLESRTEHESLSFLTITLPGLGKDFERGLEQGYVENNDFAGFSKLGRGPLPKFLGGFLSQVFCADSGMLLQEPNVDCIFAVRQLTLMFAKILVDCSQERERGAIEAYLKCEQEMASRSLIDTIDFDMEFSRVSGLLFADVFAAMEKDLQSNGLRPKHGPGATADRLVGNHKYDQTEWPVRLNESFPLEDYLIPNYKYDYVLQDRIQLLEPGAERPVRVITVPKTLKTPRIIAVEPTCMQYAQQALLEGFVQYLESERIAGNTRENLAYGMIGFTDQLPNRMLAQQGSLAGDLATLDLSEASDRVSTKHVAALTRRFPVLRKALFDSRSTKALVPGAGEIPLAKFASMGSATCFPVEAMVFLTTVMLGYQDWLNRPITRRDILSLRGKVRVYGDDIIVPVYLVHFVMRRLELYGFRVNANKSFWNGKFRESCGGDYYHGEDVTPVRVRRIMPQSRSDVSEMISLVELRNLFYQRGLWKTAGYLDGRIIPLLRYFPPVHAASPALGRLTYLPVEGERMCRDLHRPLIRAYQIKSNPPDSKISGEGALLKCLLKRGTQPFADSQHLERQGRPSVVRLKLRWMTPY